MKLIYITDRYGDRTMVRPFYTGQVIFFAGDTQPKYQEMVTLDLPGLTQDGVDAIVAWLRMHTAVEHPDNRRQIYEFPTHVWRKTVLDDFLEATNYRYSVWWMNRNFPIAEFSAFADKWLPQVQAKMRQNSAVSRDESGVEALSVLFDLADRIFTVMGQAPQRVTMERADLIHDLETVRVQVLKASPFEVGKWIETAETIQTIGILLGLLADMVSHLVNQHVSQEELHRVLGRISQSTKLRQATERVPIFWNPLKYTLRLEQNVFEETIDITTAKVQTVEWGWPVVMARRIGRIIPGRQALVVTVGDQITYIAGGRNIKFKVQQANGRLRRLGCTLTLQTERTNNLHQALLTMEQLDTLANINPQQAATQVAHLNLPANHPVYQATTAAQTDPRQSRVLADLLIELTVGIDADVARRLVRAQTGRKK